MAVMAGQRRRAGAAVRFPTREARCYHLVFAGADVREWALLDPTELADRTGRWLHGRADAALVDLVTRLIDRGEAVRTETLARPPGPALPAVISPTDLGDARARLEAATDVLRIDARNPPAPGVGYPGLWCALAVAGAAAQATGGVWLDAGSLRVRGTATPLPTPGLVRMGDHMLVAQTVEGDTALLSTTGLGSFGLPELLVAGVPTALAPAAALVLQGLAQRLIEGLVGDLADATTRGEVPAELVVTGTLVARSAPGSRVRKAGAARVRLAYRPPSDDDGPDHLAVEPAAADERRSRAEWLRSIVGELLSG